jgi:outer membrane receptor protein involved in Fe transport
MKGQDFIPLAPTLTSLGGITYQSTKGWNGSLRYRYMQNRAANEDNSVIAKGYFVADAAINYTKPKYEIGLVVENLFNARWNEAQFNTTSRLKNEPTEVTELHYTPGSPFFAKVKLAIFF